jgi:hypothetical protein
MQYLLPVGGGPSSNTWPRCASHLAHKTSVRAIKNESSGINEIFFSWIGAQKLGQPVLELYLFLEINRSFPQHTHL